MPGSIDTRQVAFGPSPFSFDMNFSTTPGALAEIEFENRTSKISIVINASYPDQGGVTTYKYEGVVIPGAVKLDDVGTEWTTEPATK
jgi:hypothetical protein